jgi:uncharacterized RDD family membrane protein YckC
MMRSSVVLSRLFLCLVLLGPLPALAQAPPTSAPPPPAADAPPVPSDEPVRLRDAVRIGQSLTLDAGQALRDAVVVMGDARIDGHVAGQLVVILGTLEIGPTAHIESEVVVVGGHARVAPGARIDGDFAVIAGGSDLSSLASVGGETTIVGTEALGATFQAVVPWLTRGLMLGRPLVPDVTWVWMVFAAFVLVQLLVHLLAHEPVTLVTATLQRRPLTSVFAGLAVLMAWGPVSILLIITVVGMLVLPFAGLALLAAGLVGRVAVARALGFGVWPAETPADRGPALRSFAVGTLLIAGAYLIPVVGLLSYAVISLAAVGAAALTIVEQWKHERPMTAMPPIMPPPIPVTLPPLPPLPPSDGPLPGAAASAPASLLRYRRARFLERGAALLIDGVLLAIVASSFDWLLPPVLDDSPLGVLAYFTGFWWWKATTPGGMVMGLRVVRLNEAPLSVLDAALRSLIAVVSFVPFGAGVFWILREPERQAWHDLAVGTVVVQVPKDVPV